MGWGNPTIWLLGVLALLLVSAGIEDARTREIANWKNAAIALLAPLWWWANGLGLWPDIAAQIGIALVVFGLFCVAFNFGWMGGGDVKMIGALALWCLQFDVLAWMLIIMSLVGGVLTMGMLVEHRHAGRKGEMEIPYGVAIAIGALVAIRQPILNHFM
jgi:prepilin peptidase CpaA